MLRYRALGILCLFATACSDPQPDEPATPANEQPAPAPAPEPAPAASRDTTIISQAPISETSAQDAAKVLRSYFALIEKGHYDAAWKLRWKGRGDDAASARAFAESFARYAEHRATVGAPGAIAGAAGSLYVDVPVQIHGRMKDGKPFATAGTMTLRRVNDVPGSSAEERRWRIYSRD